MILTLTTPSGALEVASENILYFYVDSMGDAFAVISFTEFNTQIIAIAEDPTTFTLSAETFAVFPHADYAYLLVNCGRVMQLDDLTTKTAMMFLPSVGYGTTLQIDDTIANVTTDVNTATAVSGGSGITQLTGDVTAGPGSGSQAATIANDAVTYAKMQNTSTDSILLGRGRAVGAGDVQEITLGSGLNMSGTTLSATTVIADGSITLAKQADVATGTVFYRKTAGTGAPEVQTLATLKTDLGITTTYTDLTATATPATPSAGIGRIFIDSTAKILAIKDDAGVYKATSKNAAIAAQGAGFATDTYVTKSDLKIPSWGLQVGTTFLWMIVASKTAAGTATPIYQIRIGANASTADTSRLTLTGPAQTAAISNGTLFVQVTVRAIGASTVLQGAAWWDKSASNAGFANNISGHAVGTSAGFSDSGIAGQYIGLSINGGASAAWTITQVKAEANW